MFLRKLIYIAVIGVFAVQVHAQSAEKQLQLASANIVDDGGSLRMMAPPQASQQQPGISNAGPSRSSSQPSQGAQRGVPAGDSTSVNVPPSSAAARVKSPPQSGADGGVLPKGLSEQQVMREYNSVKKFLPSNMQNLTPEQVMDMYNKGLIKGPE